jgi:MOSC domain-containing protein YiiM
VASMTQLTEVRIVALLASPLHRYEGRPKDGPAPARGPELFESIDLRAGLGVVGDRFFGQRAHANEAVTIMAAESLDAVAAELGTGQLDFARTRRNILIRGLAVDELRGATVQLGDVVLKLNRPANPCAWMDEQLADGAHRALRRRGGMRCSVLAGGTLHVGTTLARIER